MVRQSCRAATVPQSIAMNRGHSKPIHVFREGSRGCVRAGIRCIVERADGREEERRPIKGGWGRDDFKAECARTVVARAMQRATWMTSYQLFFLAEAHRFVSLSVLRGLIEKQRLQFCKIRTSPIALYTSIRILCDSFLAKFNFTNKNYFYIVVRCVFLDLSSVVFNDSVRYNRTYRLSLYNLMKLTTFLWRLVTPWLIAVV